MASELLTDRRVRAITAPTRGRLELWDAKETGLILRVASSGKKTWALQYKTDTFDGEGRRKTKKLTLGEYGDGGDKISLKDARLLAIKAKAVIADGGDPSQIKLEARAAAMEEGRRRNVATISDAVDAFSKKFDADPSQWKRRERPRILNRELSDRFGARGVGELTLADLKSQQKKIRERPAPILANRFAEAVRAFYKWAVAEYGVENAAEGLLRVTDEENYRRDRFLRLQELAAIWKAAEKLSPVARDFVRVLMLTPQRLNTVATMRFLQIDDGGVWQIHRQQKKQKVNAQALPLSDAALAIIDARRGDDEDAEKRLVFCSGRAGDVPLQATSKIKAALDKELGKKFEPWRFHDFRRSFATWAASAGIDQAVTRKILDHGQGKADKLDAIYNRFEYIEPQRAALNAYAEAING